ncbi:helix-turn-helix transcriptional regulator [Chitinimonas taiwanensis]|uniref:DNA-binding transcriptional regulator, CsgD family n=1 Tax=Chitinimonas taiwanensis DSM 18899 TaxID=1121279 RepID=A0A1K2H7X5_9NEIS|nr:helix-turn-helix transcriptional regulator [Chitinimonas taiwanensis]SFZ72717.1 DNA-binding transcriptional regulator, CsgD family [Chitinimonas taiwanensis DSM 18899]
MDEASLLDTLYAGISDPVRWREACSSLARFALCDGSAMLMLDPTRPDVPPMVVSSDVDPAMEVDYATHYAGTDPARGPGSLITDRWYHDRRDLGLDVIRKHPFYQDFFHHYGFGELICSRASESSGLQIWIALYHNLGRAEFTAAELEQLQSLLPHLRRAARLRMELAQLGLAQACEEAALNLLSQALAIVDMQGRLHFANRPAEQLLRRGLGVSIRNQYLCAQPEATFRALLQQGGQRAGAMRVGNVSSPHAIQLEVIPLPAHAPLGLGPSGPAMLVLLHEPDQSPACASQLLSALYGFTPAENRLLACLMQGHTPAECAEQLGVGIRTVRSQLTALLSKTGCRRQAELLQTVTRFGWIRH